MWCTLLLQSLCSGCRRRVGRLLVSSSCGCVLVCGWKLLADVGRPHCRWQEGQRNYRLVCVAVHLLLRAHSRAQSLVTVELGSSVSCRRRRGGVVVFVVSFRRALCRRVVVSSGVGT